MINRNRKLIEQFVYPDSLWEDMYGWYNSITPEYLYDIQIHSQIEFDYEGYYHQLGEFVVSCLNDVDKNINIRFISADAKKLVVEMSISIYDLCDVIMKGEFSNEYQYDHLTPTQNILYSLHMCGVEHELDVLSMIEEFIGLYPCENFIK